MTDIDLSLSKHFGSSNISSYYSARLEVIEFLRGLKLKSELHWEKLAAYGFSTFPTTELENSISFEYRGIRFMDNHEQSDVYPIVRVLSKLFDITEIDLEV